MRDRLLLGLAFLGDELGWRYSKKYQMIRQLQQGLFAPPDYTAIALRTAASRMFKTGLIAKKIVNNEAVWELTGLGENRLHRKFPLLKWQEKKWDGWWRIVIFDIKIKQNWIRDKLRRKLTELGFGKWQESVYVSPHDVTVDIKEFLGAEKLEEEASVLECRELWPDDPQKIERMWQLNELNQQYQKVVDNAVKSKPRQLIHWYLQAVGSDPFLPKQFLPQPWFSDSARQVIKKL